jgi:hypothetical protein
MRAVLLPGADEDEDADPDERISFTRRWWFQELVRLPLDNLAWRVYVVLVMASQGGALGTIDRVWVGLYDRVQALCKRCRERVTGSDDEGLFSRESVGDRCDGDACAPVWACR